MNPVPRPSYHWLYRFIGLLLAVSVIISGCSIDFSQILGSSPTPQPPAITTSQELIYANVIFETRIPQATGRGQVAIEILDEITGLALNPQRYPMESKGYNLFSIELPIPVGSTVKYRYVKIGNPLAIEYTAGGSQVRYRVLHVNGPALVQDITPAWTDLRYTGTTGRIKGQVISSVNNSPVPGALVFAGGAQTLTASDGTFLLEGLPPGTHNLAFYSMNGEFQAFQQGATVSENATTPATIYVAPTPRVNITFIVQIPAGNIRGLPLRLIGNLYGLGNTFADLDGGLSVIAARAPLMTMVADGVYSLTLQLPVGYDLRYKYSLGDGFWNAEHTSEGAFRTRQYIVPNQDATITDIVDSWQSDESAPIAFTVTVPASTPPQDIISIQFNPYGWTPAIPMWPLGNNRWLFVLYSPLNMLGNVGYRYCRNDQCGIADDVNTMGFDASGFRFTTSPIGQDFQDTITKWAYFTPPSQSTTIIAPQITARGEGFIAGVEFNPSESAELHPYNYQAFQNIASLGANWVVVSPSWTYTRLSPPVFEPVAGQNSLWQDAAQTLSQGQQTPFNMALFPRLQQTPTSSVWDVKHEDLSWWENWFERYRIFALHHADLATQTGAGLIILGGPDVQPAMPGGVLTDGTPSGVPGFAEDRWRAILSEIKSRYKGKIAWAAELKPNNTLEIPGWASETDFIYLIFSGRLSEADNPAADTLQQSFQTLLDETVFPKIESVGKPVILTIGYPSIDKSALGCVSIENQCLSFEVLNQPLKDPFAPQIDLQEQVDIYNAALNAINTRDWIMGFISRGYYQPASLQDQSASIHGKPASDVLWYWYPRLLGKTNN